MALTADEENEFEAVFIGLSPFSTKEERLSARRALARIKENYERMRTGRGSVFGGTGGAHTINAAGGGVGGRTDS